MFGLFRKRAKKVLPVLTAEDDRICVERENAYAHWIKCRGVLQRSLTVAERAHAEAVYQLAGERWDASVKAHKKMMERLTAEARASLVESQP